MWWGIENSKKFKIKFKRIKRNKINFGLSKNIIEVLVLYLKQTIMR